jgi:hypothetical protein
MITSTIQMNPPRLATHLRFAAFCLTFSAPSFTFSTNFSVLEETHWNQEEPLDVADSTGS